MSPGSAVQVSKPNPPSTTSLPLIPSAPRMMSPPVPPRSTFGPLLPVMTLEPTAPAAFSTSVAMLSPSPGSPSSATPLRLSVSVVVGPNWRAA
jgi:hypothetical protein